MANASSGDEMVTGSRGDEANAATRQNASATYRVTGIRARTRYHVTRRFMNHAHGRKREMAKATARPARGSNVVSERQVEPGGRQNRQARNGEANELPQMSQHVHYRPANNRQPEARVRQERRPLNVQWQRVM